VVSFDLFFGYPCVWSGDHSLDAFEAARIEKSQLNRTVTVLLRLDRMIDINV
jgi:hypothetical protein